MMFLVQQAKMTDNGTGLPPEWPVKANPCAEDAMPQMGWEKLTQAQLDALKRENQWEYDIWKRETEAGQTLKWEEEKLAEEAHCKSAEAKLAALGFTTPEIKKIMGDNYCGQGWIYSADCFAGFCNVWMHLHKKGRN